MISSPSPRPVTQRPFLFLLIPLLLAGLLTFRQYGLSWDEPLFYAYGDALGYAYTPANWFGGNFDLSLSYGPSGTDHKNRGPAYLVLARGPAHALQDLGLTQAEAWHLINFLTFLAGVYILYRLSQRWVSATAALGAAALFATQPLLWGHGFINPKDSPFLVFFLGSVWLGFRMVDRLAGKEGRLLWAVLPASICLGITTSIRVLGPLAGLLVVIYYFVRAPNRLSTAWMLLYAAGSILIMLVTWPYLWEAPLPRFFEVLRFMSDNPTGLMVLFGGQYYRAYALPHRYLPFYLAATLTEPVWPLFLAGVLTAALRVIRRTIEWKSLALVLGWFGAMVCYVLFLRPPMYDGMRHFLFILPPVFIACGLALDAAVALSSRAWLTGLLLAAVLVPGPTAGVQLHPYEYAYYNAFVGGTAAAFRQYETEYWLTCYKEAVEDLARLAPPPGTRLYVHREAYIAARYAGEGLVVLDENQHAADIRPGDYVLVNTRSNEDQRTFRGAPVVLSVARAGAVYCVVKQVP